jgi:hypothetical protein
MSTENLGYKRKLGSGHGIVHKILKITETGNWPLSGPHFLILGRNEKLFEIQIICGNCKLDMKRSANREKLLASSRRSETERVCWAI